MIQSSNKQKTGVKQMTSGAVPGVYLPPPTSQLRPPVPLSEREYNSFQPPVHNYSIWCLQISTVPSTL